MLESIRLAIRQDMVLTSAHALNRLDLYDLTTAEVFSSVLTGEVIEDYPDDMRGASCLIFGRAGETPIHSVWGYDKANAMHILITVYIPSDDVWEADLTTRKARS